MIRAPSSRSTSSSGSTSRSTAPTRSPRTAGSSRAAGGAYAREGGRRVRGPLRRHRLLRQARRGDRPADPARDPLVRRPLHACPRRSCRAPRRAAEPGRRVDRGLRRAGRRPGGAGRRIVRRPAVEHGLFPPELVAEIVVGARSSAARCNAWSRPADPLAPWPTSPAASAVGARPTRAGASRPASTRLTTSPCSRRGRRRTRRWTSGASPSEGGEELARWSWEEFRALPSEAITRDIHCVTKWSKLDTTWEGVSVDTPLDGIETGAAYDGVVRRRLHDEPSARGRHGGRAWVASATRASARPRARRGPRGCSFPHLYFWKSAKWVRGPAAHGRGRAGLLGVARVPPLR